MEDAFIVAIGREGGKEFGKELQALRGFQFFHDTPPGLIIECRRYLSEGNRMRDNAGRSGSSGAIATVEAVGHWYCSRTLG
jgi:hypothetical protein